MYRNKHRLVKRKKFIYDNCDKYVLLSKAFYPIMNRLVPQSKESKLTAISNPIKNCEREIINKENIIFCAARLVPQKNIAEMLYIWSKIQPQHEDWRFIIAGTGSEEQMLKAKSQTLQLKNIDFVGYVNPKEYYQKAKIFWMTSLFEGFGMTLVEAQSYGCVPVAYDSFASLHDIIDSEVNGLIIPFGNRKQFEEETIKLINNPEKFKRLSESAQESVGRFDIDIIVEQWRQLLETI